MTGDMTCHGRSTTQDKRQKSTPTPQGSETSCPSAAADLSFGNPGRVCSEAEYTWLQYRVPALLAVGLEGFWGLVICAVALPVLTVMKGPNGAPLDSLPAAIRVRPPYPRATMHVDPNPIGSKQRWERHRMRVCCSFGEMLTVQ